VTPTAEQIAEALYDAELQEIGLNESPSYYYGFRMGALAAIRALREAGVDLDHVYTRPDLGIDEPWTAAAEWTDAFSGAHCVKIIGAELFVRRPLGGVS